MTFLRNWHYLRYKPEPLRQAALLLAFSGAAGRGDCLLQTLDAMARDSRGQWGDNLRRLHSLLEAGHSLSSAMSLIDDFMPDQTVAAINVAEETHSLSSVLSDEARRLTHTIAAESTVRPGLDMLFVWLLAVGTMLITVVSFICIWIIPKFRRIMEDFEIALPVPLSRLASFTDFIAAWLPLFILPLLAMLAGGYWYGMQAVQQKLVRGTWPVLSGRMRYRLPEVLRVLSLAIASNGSLTDAVAAAIRSCPPGQASDRLLQLRNLLESGEQLFPAMQTAGIVRGDERSLLESARLAGNADWALRQMADRLDERARRRADFCLTLLEPALVLISGGIVLWVATAVMIPLLKLVNDLS